MGEPVKVIQRYRKKPILVEALQWTGKNLADVENFVGQNWGRADAHEVFWDHEDSHEVVIFNSLEKAWVPCPLGSWIIRGVKGEFYPCAHDVFQATYEKET